MPSVAELIYVKTNIGGFFFDAFFNVDHTSKTKITSHPVQTGANITDHAYQEPDELSIEIGMSDCMQDIIQGQFGGGWSRSVTAYEVLREMQQQRIPMQILTRLKLYKNMMIETISVPDNLATLYGLRATITFREIIVASVKTVKISANPQVTDSTNMGNVEVKPVTDESLRAQWYEATTGVTLSATSGTSINGKPKTFLGVYAVNGYGLDSNNAFNKKILSLPKQAIAADKKWPLGTVMYIGSSVKEKLEMNFIVAGRLDGITGDKIAIYYDINNPTASNTVTRFGTQQMNVWLADG